MSIFFFRTGRRRLYQSWYNMCRYQGRRDYEVPPPWRRYQAFEAWALANGWRDGLLLTRLNKDVGFVPENCAWMARYSEDRRPFRAYVKQFIHGRPAVQVAEDSGISVNAFRSRVFRGWDVERAATEPSRRRRLEA